MEGKSTAYAGPHPETARKPGALPLPLPGRYSPAADTPLPPGDRKNFSDGGSLPDAIFSDPFCWRENGGLSGAHRRPKIRRTWRKGLRLPLEEPSPGKAVQDAYSSIPANSKHFVKNALTLLSFSHKSSPGWPRTSTAT